MTIAIVATAYGGPEVLSAVDIDVPPPGAGEVSIRVKAAAVNVFTAAAVWLVRASRVRPSPSRSMATRQDMATLMPKTIARQAVQLRASLAGMKPQQIPHRDLGMSLGMLLPGRQELMASWEDTITAVFAPRSGKTTGIAVPRILDAPGAVVATSNKADLVLVTSTLREQQTGERSWIFDPQHIVFAEQDWWWNPLGGHMSMDDAQRLAGAFVLAVQDTEKREIWGQPHSSCYPT